MQRGVFFLQRGVFFLQRGVFFLQRRFLGGALLFPGGAFRFPGGALLFGLRLQCFQMALDAALHAQVVLPRLIGMVGALFVGKGFQRAHGLPHFVGLHPVGQVGCVQPLAVLEKFQPALLFGFDSLGGELVQLQQPDPAVIEEAAACVVAQLVDVGVGRVGPQQVLGQQPDGVGGAQCAIVLAAAQLRAVQVGPGVEDAGRQVGVAQQLNLDLIESPLLVAGLDVDDAELVVEEFALVVGIEDVGVADRGGQGRAEHGIEKVDQQPPVGLGPQQGLEDTVDLGVDGVAHGRSLDRIGAKGQRPKAPRGR